MVSKWLIVNWLENAKFLDDNKRALLLHRLKDDDGYAKIDYLDRDTLKRILRD